MAATSDNYDIVTSGITYTIAADYVKPEGAGETAHHQIVKVAYGANDTVIYASTSTPLPVGISGSWANYNFIPSSGITSLATTIVGITGTSLTVVGVSGGVAVGITVGTLNVAGVSGGVAVGITVGTLNVAGISGGVALGITVGTLNVAGSSFSIRNLYGGETLGSTAGIDYVGIQGIASGYPIGITLNTPLPVTISSFASLSLSNLGIFGVTGATAVYVQASAPLPVGLCGSWGRYEFLAPSGVYSLATTIVGITGTSLTVVGVSGGVAVGITVGTLNVAGSSFSIRNLYGGATLGSTAGIDYVGIQGIASGYPIGITVSAALPVTVSSFSNLGIFGVTGATAVYVQGSNFSIRGITAATDTITVYGTGIESTVPTSLYAFAGSTAAIEAVYSTNNALNVNVSTITGVTVSATDLDIRNLNYTTDTVTIVGQGAADSLSLSTVPTYMNAAVSSTGTLTRVGGTTGAGWCGAAVNMYLVNSGFSLNAYATFSAQIGITAPSYAPIPVTGTTSAEYGLWVAGDTANGPVIVKGYSGGFMPIELANLDTPTSTVNATIAQVKTNTDFLIAMKKALYDSSVSVGAFDFNDKSSIYTLVRDSIGDNLALLGNSVVANGASVTSQSSMAVTVVGSKQQPSFMSRTGFVGFAAKNLNEFNSGAGFTCGSGVRIKTARVASGASASSNQFLCVMSIADASLYGATSGTASYILYHGEEMFFDVDNINRIQVFYPAYSSGFAPSNTSQGMTFSFYAS
jgi:hypothetical protein